jgi:hypothetical protein
MSVLKFSDGIEFELQGPYRIESRADGLYVVGHGMLCPIKDRAEGEKMIREYAPKEERCPN